MRQISIIFLLLTMLALTVGCSGSGNPTTPVLSDGDQGDNLIADIGDSTPPQADQNERQGGDTGTPDVTQALDEDEHPLQGQRLQGSRTLWGLYTFLIDTVEDTCEIVPLRGANMHLNALKFLEPGGNYGMVQLQGGLNWNMDKTELDLDIQLTHPFPSHPQFSGFDVKGILITRATFSGLTDPGLVFPGGNEFRLLNSDGYSRWWNPVEFEGNTIFSYTDGALGMKDSVWDFTSTLNGYKCFSDELALSTPLETQNTAMRGVFSAGATNARHYRIAVPSFPSSLIFNYAIDANWEPPLTKPPVIPDDFPPEANQPEPWAIVATETVNTLFYDEILSEQGGELILEVAVYDWQNATPAPGGTIERVVGEWPGLFEAAEAGFVSDQGDYAIWELILTPTVGALISTEDVEYMIWAESTDGAGYGGILDASVPLISSARFSAVVSTEEPNVAPQISQGVTGNASPGLVSETYTVLAYDANDDPMIFSWTVDPHIADDPGNGDGTLDVDWSVFGFGDFTVECTVTDSINPAVSATPLEVSVGNIPPNVGPVMGPDDVSAADTDAKYTVLASDPDVGQTLSYMWSFVPNGDLPDFTIPGDVADGSLTVDFSAVDPGLYDISCQVSDGFADVPSLPLIVTHNNTPPTVGEVTGQTPVTLFDTDELYEAPWSDPDTTQTLSFLWSVVDTGLPPLFVIPSNPDGSVNLDWSGYTGGQYDVNLVADDGIDLTEGTLLTVTLIENAPPSPGAVTGPNPVTHADTASDYSVLIADPDGDPLTVNWSVVPSGAPPDYSIPGNETDPLTVDWSIYLPLGDYDINVQVDDTYNTPVEGTLLTVTIENTLPDVGTVTGLAIVDGNNVAENYSATIDDIDTLQVHTVLWSVVPTGDPADFSIPALGDNSVDIDWSGYDIGDFDVNLQVNDGFGPVEGTSLLVKRINTLSEIGPITGAVVVDCSDTDTLYSSTITDVDTSQVLTILWSLELTGQPENFILADNGDGSINIDWSGFAVGMYELNVQVDDGFDPVQGTALIIDRENTPPVVGAVDGPAVVHDAEIADYTLVPATTDCDPGDVINYAWSIVPAGDPPDYSIPTATANLNVDWSGYGLGLWSIGCRADDSYGGSSYATPLNVTVTLHPCVGSAHTWLGEIYPNKYSVVGAMSVLPRADIAFLEGGISLFEGMGIAQTGPQTIGLFNADSTGNINVANIYNLGTIDAVVSLDSETQEGRILIVTALEPSKIKVIDSSVILGNPYMHPIESGDPLVTFVALDVEEDGDLWAVQRNANGGIVYTLERYTFVPYNSGSPGDPVYTYDPSGSLDITSYVGTETDIFDIAINNYSDMLYLLEGGAIGQGTMQTFHVVDGFAAYFMGTLGSALFSQPLEYDESAFLGFVGYADIDVDHVDPVEERCRILLYGRLEDLSSELIRMDASYNILDTQNWPSAWPAFAINPDLDPMKRNLIMPDIDSVEFWDTPLDW